MIRQISLYDEGASGEISIGEITQYLRGKLGKIAVEVRGNSFAGNLPADKVSAYARRIAATKIQDRKRKMVSLAEPLYAEIEYEKRRILGKTRAFGVIYDGFQLQSILAEIIPKEESGLEFVQVFLTNRLFATWDGYNQLYHLRTSVYGIPAIISTTGLIEAPAKPREYYLLKQQYGKVGTSSAELRDSFKMSFLDYGDKRLTEVAKGYVMQAVMYFLTGDPFCEDKGCRLYNAHWQEELIFAQLESGYEFCEEHTRVLDSILQN